MNNITRKTLSIVCGALVGMSAITCVFAVDTYENIAYISNNAEDFSEEMNKILKQYESSKESPLTINIEKGNYSIDSKIYMRNEYVNVVGNGSTFVNNCDGEAFNIKESENVSFTDMTVNNGVKAFAVGDNKELNTKNISFTNVKVNNTQRTGIHIQYTTGKNVLKNCVVKGAGENGLIVQNNSNATIEGGSYCNNGLKSGAFNGISVTRNFNVNMNNVDVSGNGANGISPVGDKTNNKGVLNITNCTFNNNGSKTSGTSGGNGVAGAEYVQINIKNVTANKNYGNGVMLRSNSSSKGIDKLTANNNRNSGLLIQTNSTCKSILNCNLSGNGKNGLSLSDVTTTVKNIKTSKNKVNGISVNDTKGGYKVTVEKATADSNSLTGIYGIKTTMYIKNSKITNNKVNQIVFNTSKGCCKKNTVTGGQFGIVAQSNSNVSDISQNTVKNAVKKGITFNNSTVNTYKDNILSNPRSAYELHIIGKGKAPTSVKTVNTITVNCRAGDKKITGLNKSLCKPLFTFVNGKKLKASVDKRGNYTVKLGKKLKKGDRVTVKYTDKYGNSYTTVKYL